MAVRRAQGGEDTGRVGRALHQGSPYTLPPPVGVRTWLPQSRNGRSHDHHQCPHDELPVPSGTNIKSDVRMLQSPPSLLVATPGRLNDLLYNYNLGQLCGQLKMLIFDEVRPPSVAWWGVAAR